MDVGTTEVKIRALVPAFLISLLVSGCGSSAEPEGTLAPKFSVQTVSTPVRLLGLDDFKGKVVLVDFWATWCVPCRATMPIVHSIYQDYKDKGLDVVAITDEPRSKVEEFRNLNKQIDYPMYLDNNHVSAIGFGLRTLPTMFIINRKGRVVYTHVGGDIDQYKLKDILEASLKS